MMNSVTVINPRIFRKVEIMLKPLFLYQFRFVYYTIEYNFYSAFAIASVNLGVKNKIRAERNTNNIKQDEAFFFFFNQERVSGKNCLYTITLTV